jgi:hypothetical protein
MKRRPPDRGNIDRVEGIRSRERRDFFSGCNEPGTPAFQPNPADFMRVWCARCRRSDCVRAKSAVRSWENRMAEQPEYLLNDPNFSDMTDPRHQDLAKMYFASLKAKAERLEIAASRQDWEIPEGPTDGIARVVPGSVTDDFDVAVRELARAKGKDAPELPREATVAAPPFYEEETESDFEYETPYPSSTTKGLSYRVALSRDGTWSCECDGFKHLGKCYHLDEVRAWYEQPDEPEAPEAPPAAPAAPPVAREVPPPRDPRVPEQRPINTPMPNSGVMIGGGVAPPAQPGRPPTPPRVVEPPDPWTPRNDNVVEPGATIRPKKP